MHHNANFRFLLTGADQLPPKPLTDKNPRPKKIGIVYAVRVRPAAVDIRNTAGNARSIDG